MLKHLRVRDFMSTKLPTFTADLRIADAMQVLLKHRISGALVLDRNGSLVGILTERDCFKTTIDASYHNLMSGTVGDFMSRKLVTVDADDDIMTVAGKFLQHNFRRFPVLDEGVPVGQISRRDVLRALQKANK